MVTQNEDRDRTARSAPPPTESIFARNWRWISGGLILAVIAAGIVIVVLVRK